MLTIGKKYLGPLYNWVDRCDLCGVPYERDKLYMNIEQKLMCPSCKEKTPMELDMMNAANASKPMYFEGKTRRR